MKTLITAAAFILAGSLSVHAADYTYSDGLSKWQGHIVSAALLEQQAGVEIDALFSWEDDCTSYEAFLLGGTASA